MCLKEVVFMHILKLYFLKSWAIATAISGSDLQPWAIFYSAALHKKDSN